MFKKKGRVQQKKEGLLFYQKDLLLSEYPIGRDGEVSVNIDYYTPGIGIVLQGYNNESLIYIFRLGTRDFSAIKKERGFQDKITHSTNFRPIELPVYNKNIRLHKEGNRIDFYEDDFMAGSLVIPDNLDMSYFGIYSNKDNIIKDISVRSGGPERWRTGVGNTDGGYIRFYRQGFKITDSLYNAEVEQNNVYLNSGDYYLDYEKEGDITPYVYYSDDTRINDQEKDILEENNRIRITEPSLVNVKFKGTEGDIREIALKDSPHDRFIPTHSSIRQLSGSKIIVDLSVVDRIEWLGTILEEPLPEEKHGIIANEYDSIRMEDLDLIEVGKEIRYSLLFSGDDPTVLTSIPGDRRNHILLSGDNRLIKAIDAYWLEKERDYNIYVTEEGEEIIDIESYEDKYMIADPWEKDKEYIEGDRVIEDGKRFRCVNGHTSDNEENRPVTGLYYDWFWDKESMIKLKEDGDPVKYISTQETPTITPTEDEKIFIFYNLNAKICEMTIHYKDGREFNILAQYNSRHHVPDTARSPIIVVDDDNNPLDISSSFRFYNKISPLTNKEEPYYIFTNWERELFTDPTGRLALENTPNKTIGSIYVYAIPEGSETNMDSFYEIPYEGEDIEPNVHSISSYTDFYVQLETDDYGHNENINYVEVYNPGALFDGKKVKEIIVEYLKEETYCINYNFESRSYEVDIASTDGAAEVQYDIIHDGYSAQGVSIGDIPEEDEYVVLSNEEKLEEV